MLIFRVRPDTIKNMQPVENAPLQHVAVPDNMTSSPLSAALDPRVEERTVHEQMQRTNPAAGAGEHSAR
ncbi:hypothetical protein D3C84_981860 [compost metagenome]